MKLALIFLLSCILATNAYANPICFDIFARKVESTVEVVKSKSDPVAEKALREEVLKTDLSDVIEGAAVVLKSVRDLRDKINFWRRFSGEASRQALNNIRMKRKYFVFLFKNAQDATVAIDLYRDVFIDVEFSYFRLKQVEKSIKAGKKPSISAQEMQALKEAFAKNYADYQFIRASIERIAEGRLTKVEEIEASKQDERAADIGLESAVMMAPASQKRNDDIARETAIKNANYVLDSLGTPTFAGAHPTYKITRPTIKEIQDLFRQNTDLLLIKLKEDLRLQRRYGLRLLPITMIQEVQGLVIKYVPESYRAVVSAFIGLNYNSFVLKRYLADIERVIETPNLEPNQRLEVLRVVSSNKSTDEFLTTFARLTLYSKQWVELKQQAEDMKDEPLYARFYEQMKAAEQAAIKADSWLTPFYEPSFIDHVRIWLAPLVTTVGVETGFFSGALETGMGYLHAALQATGLGG